MMDIASKSSLTELVLETLLEVLNDKEALSLYGREVNTLHLIKRVNGLKV